MPLSAVNFVPLTGNIKSADLRGFFDLFTGAMTDQPVTFANTLQVGGSQGAGVPPIRIVGVAAQTANMIEARALAADVQPIFSVGPTGTLSWGPGAAVGPDVSLRRSAPNQLTLQGLAGTPALVIPVGGLQVSAGNVGIGGPPLVYDALYISGTLNAALNTSARALQADVTLVAGQNNDVLYGFYLNPSYNDNGKTGVRHIPMWTGGNGVPWFLASWTAAAGFFSGGFTADAAYHEIVRLSVTSNGGILNVRGVTPPLVIGTAAGQVFVGVSIDGGAITGYSRFNPVNSLNTLPVDFLVSAAAGTHTVSVFLNCATGMGAISPDGGAGNTGISVFELR